MTIRTLKKKIDALIEGKRPFPFTHPKRRLTDRCLLQTLTGRSFDYFEVAATLGISLSDTRALEAGFEGWSKTATPGGGADEYYRLGARYREAAVARRFGKRRGVS